MKKFTEHLYQDLQVALQEIADLNENQLIKSERSRIAAQKSLLKLKAFIVCYTFKDANEEILFFKEIKPKFLSELIFHREVYFAESRKPVGDAKEQVKHCRRILENINQYFERYHFLYLYYQKKRSDMDEQYFLRNGGIVTENECDTNIDPLFSTPYSCKFSKIIAMERLSEYVDYLIRQSHHHFVYPQQLSEDILLRWTDKKAGLIEMLYGLQSMGSFNNSQAELNQIVRLFEIAFNVDLGNYSRTFQEIRIRKKGRTPFLDRMKEMLLKKNG
jgi:hypothetical protein